MCFIDIFVDSQIHIQNIILKCFDTTYQKPCVKCSENKGHLLTSIENSLKFDTVKRHPRFVSFYIHLNIQDILQLSLVKL